MKPGRLGQNNDYILYNNRVISDAERTVEAVRGGEGKRLTYRQPDEA